MTGHGVHDASRDIETIARWWREHPDANVGVACGTASGIDVVDVDGEAGRFAYHPARPIGNRVRGLPGIDTRSDGGKQPALSTP